MIMLGLASSLLHLTKIRHTATSDYLRNRGARGLRVIDSADNPRSAENEESLSMSVRFKNVFTQNI